MKKKKKNLGYQPFFESPQTVRSTLPPEGADFHPVAGHSGHAGGGHHQLAQATAHVHKGAQLWTMPSLLGLLGSERQQVQLMNMSGIA